MLYFVRTAETQGEYVKLVRFVDIMEAQCIALAFGDVLSAPGFSKVLPKDTLLNSVFTPLVALPNPLASAAMDMVTDGKMAIQMALNGGIGVIHRAQPPDAQATMVRETKRHQNGFIRDPKSVLGNQTVGEVKHTIKSMQYPFHRFLVLGSEGDLLGISSEEDRKYCDDETKPVSEYMTPAKDLTVIDESVSDTDAYRRMKDERKETIVVRLGKGSYGMFRYKYLDRFFKGKSTANVDDNRQLRAAGAVGVAPGEIERVELLLQAGCDVIVIDVAHAHSLGVCNMVRLVRQKFPNAQIVAGNICTPEAAFDLVNWGADAIKVGIGPGSICTTREVTGIGWPQLSAIGQIFVGLLRAGGRYKDVPIIADGGASTSSDVAKALMFGASSVMCGSVFAGTEEAPGEMVLDAKGQRVKKIRGMGSESAMRETKAAADRYFLSDVPIDKLVAEGVEGYVPYKGPLSLTIDRLIGGVRQSMGYLGAKTIKEMPMKVNPIRITEAGKIESAVHGIQLAA